VFRNDKGKEKHTTITSLEKRRIDFETRTGDRIISLY